MSYTVAKNTSFLTAASIGQKLISFVYFTIVARLIGVENTGQYFFALTYQSIFAVVADFGSAAVLTREMAKLPGKIQSIFSTALGNKLLFGSVAYILVAVSVNVLGYAPATKNLIYLAGLTMFFDNFHSLFYAVFRANRNLKYESFGIVGSQFLTLVVGTIALVNHWSLIWLIAAYTIPSFLNVLYSGFFVLRKCAVKLKLSFEKSLWREFLIMAWPFACAGIIGRLYSYSDSLLMSKMLTGRELGAWSVPYKITFAFQFVALSLSASVYPVFSALWATDKVALAKLFEKSWRYLFSIVFPLSAGIFAIAAQFIMKVYGADYADSIFPLRVLSISLIFGYLAIICASMLNAIGQQRKQTLLMTIALVASIACNLFLLPRYGINGAAFSALFSNLLMWAIGFAFVKKYANVDCKIIFKYALQTLVPAFIMGALVYWLCGRISFLYAVPIGVVAYFALLFMTGGMSKEIILEVKSKIFGKNTGYVQ